MRPLVVVLTLTAALVAAGCATPTGTVEPDDGAPLSPESAPDAPGSPPAPGNAPASPDKPRDPPSSEPQPSQEVTGPPSADEPTFCDEEAGCDFWDDDYHEFTLYEVDTLHLDVLIVPSASPGATQDTAITRQAVEAWYAGIQALAAPWFAEALTMDVYVLGEDTPPQSAIEDPEIVVLAAEYNPVLLFGIGWQNPPTPCRSATLATYAAHEHGGLRVLAAECQSGGFTCLAINTNNLGGGEYSLYDLVAHEFGHCLGGGHVGDALDFKAKRVPVHDIMSYQSDEAQVHCVSNLNVRVLEGVYAGLAGADVEALAPGDYYAMPPASYRQLVCENPA